MKRPKMSENEKKWDKMRQNETNQDIISQIQNITEAEIKKLLPRSTAARWIKWLRDAELEKTISKSGLEVLTVFLSTPLGQWLATIIILELLAKTKFFSQISVDVLIGVMTSVEVIKAIGGGQSMVSTIAGLAGLFS